MKKLKNHIFDIGAHNGIDGLALAINNKKSNKAALRLGFKFEGIFRQATIYKKRNRDTSWYAIIDKDWKKIKKGYLKYLSSKNLDKNLNQKRSLKLN